MNRCRLVGLYGALPDFPSSSFLRIWDNMVRKVAMRRCISNTETSSRHFSDDKIQQLCYAGGGGGEYFF